MNIRWQFIERKLNQIITNLSIDLKKSLDIKEYLEHNEFGLAFDSIISIIDEQSMVISTEIISDLLQVYYEMDCNVEISELLMKNSAICLFGMDILDGGYIVAFSNPYEEELSHFNCEFGVNLSQILLVKYADGYNEIFVDDCNESIQDNAYSNLFDLENAIRKIKGNNQKRVYTFIYNQSCTQKYKTY